MQEFLFNHTVHFLNLHDFVKRVIYLSIFVQLSLLYISRQCMRPKVW